MAAGESGHRDDVPRFVARTDVTVQQYFGTHDALVAQIVGGRTGLDVLAVVVVLADGTRMPILARVAAGRLDPADHDGDDTGATSVWIAGPRIGTGFPSGCPGPGAQQRKDRGPACG